LLAWLKRMQTSTERNNERTFQKLLEKWGGYESVRRFVANYGKTTTKKLYLYHLDRYFDWLPTHGVNLTPDELVTDKYTVWALSDRD
jgi:hypothetical protein